MRIIFGARSEISPEKQFAQIYFVHEFGKLREEFVREYQQSTLLCLSVFPTLGISSEREYRQSSRTRGQRDPSTPRKLDHVRSSASLSLYTAYAGPLALSCHYASDATSILSCEQPEFLAHQITEILTLIVKPS
jgi:hypothetical protein